MQTLKTNEMEKEETKTEFCKAAVSGSYLTVRQLNDACKKHHYILARFASGYQMGINSKVAIMAQKRKKYDANELTEFVSFFPCDINTYINHKHPFM